MTVNVDNEKIVRAYKAIGGVRLIFTAWTVTSLVVFQGILYGIAEVENFAGYSLPPMEKPVLLLAYGVWTALWTVFYEFAKSGVQKKTGVWAARILLGASLAGWFAFNISLTFRPLL